MSHKVFFNSKKNKNEDIINILITNLNRRYKYELHIASCYLSNDLEQVFKFILNLNQHFKLDRVIFYIDARQVVKSGIENINKYLVKKINEKLSLDVAFNVVDDNVLFHTKALILKNEHQGILLIGSSNFSDLGLFSQQGNYESLIFTTENDDIDDFLSTLPRNKFRTLEHFSEFKSADNLTFQYAILQQGRFVHKWQQTINQYFAVKYDLTEYGRIQISSNELKELGFDTDVASISRQFFKFNDGIHEINDEYKRLRSKGIETYLGHWIPISLIPKIDNKKFEYFLCDLESVFHNQIIHNREEMDKVFHTLLYKNFISHYSQPPEEILLDKFAKLKENHTKLLQFMYKFEFFELPYDFSQKNEITKLYEYLHSACVNRGRKNQASDRFLHSVEKLNPMLINHIDDSEM